MRFTFIRNFHTLLKKKKKKKKQQSIRSACYLREEKAVAKRNSPTRRPSNTAVTRERRLVPLCGWPTENAPVSTLYTCNLPRNGIIVYIFNKLPLSISRLLIVLTTHEISPIIRQMKILIFWNIDCDEKPISQSLIAFLSNSIYFFSSRLNLVFSFSSSSCFLSKSTLLNALLLW